MPFYERHKAFSGDCETSRRFAHSSTDAPEQRDGGRVGHQAPGLGGQHGEAGEDGGGVQHDHGAATLRALGNLRRHSEVTFCRAP